jgi:ankyrin repeat protein/Tfp pilus assembly protein PilF
MSTSPIPPHLRELLHFPKHPWTGSPAILQRAPTESGLGYQKWELLSSDPEASFATCYFWHTKPHRYAISKIFCVHNPSQVHSFEQELIYTNSEAKRFLPAWQKESMSSQKKVVIKRWQEQSFVPTLSHQALNSVRILPLWQGHYNTSSTTLCTQGITALGKYPQKSSCVNLCHGVGFYFTNSAHYASLHSTGALLLAWVSMREPYPVVNDLSPPNIGCEIEKLSYQPAYQNYNAHYIPLVSLDSVSYPCSFGQKPSWDEIVVFDKRQTLFHLWIELTPDTPAPLIQESYSFAALYAACQRGEFHKVQTWIEQNPQRLLEHDLGKTLFHAAAEGNHRLLLEWLLSQYPIFLDRIFQDSSFILKLAEQPTTQSLAFLFSRGLNSKSSNKFKQTLLHVAAQAGQIENVQLLLNQGAEINAQDLSQRTPLFLAVQQGHRAIVQLLLKHQARIDLRSMEGDTILHVAAFYGHLLQELFPICQSLIEAQDEDGKTPLHKAVWGDPKPDVVALLLAQGANPQAVNIYDYTPLHWAAKHGHLRSVELLCQKEANPHCLNVNNDSPIDLAIKFGQDAVIHFFLGTTKRLKLEPPSKDLEGYYYTCLKAAKTQCLLEEQIFFLEKLSNLYIEKQQFVMGAKILNTALALLKNNPLFEKHLLAKLERIEGLFLESQGIKTDAARRNYLTIHRVTLQANRQKCIGAVTIQTVVPAENEAKSLITKEKEEKSLRKEILQPIDSEIERASAGTAVIQNILANLTATSKNLLQVLIKEAQQALGPPPVQWACMGMGSMSRDEMCPYSDIEFAFLIEKETPEALIYFRRLAQLLQLQIINLGETPCPVFGNQEPSPTPNGFCMDTGGNTPLGKPGLYELIGTPKQIARFQTLKWISDEIILANALSCVCWVMGSTKLVDMYISEKTAIQRPKRSWSEYFNGISPQVLSETLAMRLLAGHLTEFAPNLSKEKEQDNAFGIKKELYRPLQEILSSLAIFYDLKSCNSFERIDELVKKEVFSKQGGDNLKQALHLVIILRLAAHLFYKDEKEFLCHPEEGKPQDPHLLYLDSHHIEILHEIYKVLIPFHKAVKEFFSTRKKQTLNTQLFYDEGPTVRAFTLEQTLRYKEAQAAYQEAVSLNPNDIKALTDLGNMESRLGNGTAALERVKKALELIQKAYGEEHIDVATIYNNIGTVLADQGKYDEALILYNKTCDIQLKVLGKMHPHVAGDYNNIGASLKAQGKYDESLTSHKKALDILLNVLGEEHPHVAISYHNIGRVLEAQEKYDEALIFYNKALDIQLKVLGEMHPDVAASYNSIGLALHSQEKYDEALISHNKALNIRLKVLGKEHPNVAISYYNIGLVLKAQGKYNAAVTYLKKALNIDLKVFGERHPNLAISYHNIGSALYCQGEYNEALMYLKKSLNIDLQVLGNGHPNLALSYQNIIIVLEKMGDHKQAEEYKQKIKQD